MRPVRALAFLVLCLPLVSSGLGAEDLGPSPVSVEATPLAFDPGEDEREAFGALLWRGGLKLRSRDPRFGGFSGLVVSPDGSGLLAVSDQGWWLELALSYDGKGRLSGAGDARMATLLDGEGKRFAKKSLRDAETLTALGPEGPSGPVAVGLERTVRLLRYDIGRFGLEARAEPMPLTLPKALHDGPNNKELEAVASLGGNRFLAISEENVDKAGNIRAWILGEAKPLSFSVRRLDDFAITDVAMVSPDRFLTLERSFSASERRLEMAIRRFRMDDVAEGAAVDGELLLRARWPSRSIDNMEALDVHRTADGETRITLMSDDNYNAPLQRTLILQFALPGQAD
ncbi:esterase-like activity of phytase family protein [Kaustia mangrovi]|uniref:Esterase-like activity of phytase family protein n=1 Tax=Kaustia mangrovi TaxID=2593653 RepID=A0A7S8HBF3_9HYPH|nr:esterase-like activity of phytase family protein [Kaustia mangrovi]QPC42436.1 esterase-like activity of phytase family protein [Kaustia mangrovi]